VRWFKESRLFMCPCHGGAYYEDGSVPRATAPGLFEYEYEIRQGQLWVRGGQSRRCRTRVMPVEKSETKDRDGSAGDVPSVWGVGAISGPPRFN